MVNSEIHSQIAFLSDIHGNLPALKQVLMKIHELQPRLIIIGGDVVGIGPFPAECLELLLAEPNVKFILGNHERDTLNAQNLTNKNTASQNESQHFQWVAAQLSDSQKSIIAQLPLRLDLNVNGTQMLFLHYAYDAKRNNFHEFQPSTVKFLDKLFSSESASIIVFGHDHKSYDSLGRCRYLNPGSLGCNSVAKARFLILEFRSGKWIAELQSIPYDDRPLYEAFESRNVPDRPFLYKAFFGNRFSVK